MQNNIQLIFGKKGSGKTTLAKKLIDDNIQQNLLIWDFLGEYSDSGLNVKDKKSMIKLLEHKNNPIVAFPESKRIVYSGTEKNDFPFICEWIRICSNILFIIEEVDYVCSPSYIDISFSSLIRYGRHWGVNILAISRRPAEVNRLLTSQADNCYCFKFIEPRDVEYLTKYMGINNKKITELEQYKYYEHKF